MDWFNNIWVTLLLLDGKSGRLKVRAFLSDVWYPGNHLKLQQRGKGFRLRGYFCFYSRKWQRKRCLDDLVGSEIWHQMQCCFVFTVGNGKEKAQGV